MSDCNHCQKGYAEGVSLPSSSSSSSSSDPSSVPLGGYAKVGDPVVKLSAGDFPSYEQEAAPINESVSVQQGEEMKTSCAQAQAACKPLYKAPTYMLSPACASSIKIIGVDEYGNVASLCGSGYPRVEKGQMFLDEQPQFKAEFLWHETTTNSSGQVMVGAPKCAPHIVLSDAQGNVWSQKPAQGQNSVLVGNGETGEWCQVDLSELPTCFTGPIEQVEEVEIIGVASPKAQNIAEEGIRCAKALKGEGLVFLEKVEDPSYQIDCDQGYRYVARSISVEELKGLLGIDS